MNDAITKLNELTLIWADAMWSVLWQSTLWALVVAAALSVCRWLPPSLRCWAWRIVAIKMLLLPFWMVSVPVPRLSTATPMPAAASMRHLAAQNGPVAARPGMLLPASDQASPTPAADVFAPPQSNASWQTWLAAVWLTVILVQLVRLGWQCRQLKSVLATAQLADEAIRHFAIEGCQRLHIARVPELRVTAVEVSPFVCGITRPTLVLPTSIAQSRGEIPLRQIVLHELAHVRRRDLAWCWITHVARMVFWFHPVAHWLAFREALERELACDELAMSHSGATAADYAQTLIEAVSRVARPAVLQVAAAAHLDGGRG